MPTTSHRNGEAVAINVRLRKERTLEISCLNKPVNLVDLSISSKVGWSQKDVDKLFKMLEQLQVCHGKEVHPIPHSNLHNIENWSILGNENPKTTQRSRDNVVLRNTHDPSASASNPESPSRDDDVSNDAVGDNHGSAITVPADAENPTTDHTFENDGDDGCNDDDENDKIMLIQEDHNDMSVILEKVLPTAPENMKELLMAQAGNLKCHPNRRSWSTNVISVCLRLWSRSPKAVEC